MTFRYFIFLDYGFYIFLYILYFFIYVYIYILLIYSRAILSFAWLTGYATHPVVLLILCIQIVLLRIIIIINKKINGENIDYFLSFVALALKKTIRCKIK